MRGSSLLRFAVPLPLAALAVAPAPCERLRSLSLPNTTITAAESVAAGPFPAPTQAGLPADSLPNSPVMLPGHYRVAAVSAS